MHYIYGDSKFNYTQDGKEYQLEISRDDFEGNNPREWDNCGTIAASYRDYILCDEGHDDPDEEADEILRDHGYEDEELYDMTYNEKMLKIAEYDDIVLLHLFVYDHSGITISTGGFVDSWDSSRIGFIYVTKEKFFKNYSQDEQHWRDLARQYLEDEVEIFNKYIQGEVYWYSLSVKEKHQEKCPHCGVVIKEYDVWEDVDSCGGFYCDTLEDLANEACIEINWETLKEVK